jgi:cellulose biosynthesis protein BcsQ
MSDLENYQKKSPLYISFCTQKGGAGKSVFTILAATYQYNEMGFNVAVMDCDYPQWSVHKLRECEKTQIPNNAFYLKKAQALFQRTNKPTYHLIPTKPETAWADAEKFLANEKTQYDLILFDLSGTVNNHDAVNIYFNMDYLFVPITVSRINMESALYFMISVNDILKKTPGLRLKGVHTFWNRMSAKRELAKINYHIHTAAIKHNLIPAKLTRSKLPLRCVEYRPIRYDRQRMARG